MIRNAKPDDTESIRTLLIQLEYDPPQDLESRIQRASDDPNEYLLVYELNDEVVAFIDLRIDKQLPIADFARIAYFSVKDSARSLGIGRQLEEHITTLARQRHCDRIEVHCHTRRTDAHRFYERQGYEESPKYFIKSLRSPEP